MSDTQKEKLEVLLKEAASIIRSKANSEILALLRDGIVDESLGTMALASPTQDKPSVIA